MIVVFVGKSDTNRVYTFHNITRSNHDVRKSALIILHLQVYSIHVQAVSVDVRYGPLRSQTHCQPLEE